MTAYEGEVKLKNKKIYIILFLFFSGIFIFNKFKEYKQNEWKKIDIAYGEMIEVPEMVGEKIYSQEMSFSVTEDNLIWGFVNNSFKTHYFEYGSIDFNLENKVTAQQNTIPYEDNEMTIHTDNVGLVSSINAQNKVELEKASYVSSKLEEAILYDGKYDEEKPKSNFELNENQLLQLSYTPRTKNKESDYFLSLLDIEDTETIVVKKVKVSELFSNEIEEITSISIDKKNIYITTSNKKIKIYNDELELKKEVDLSHLVSDDFKYYLKLDYIEQEEKGLLQVAAEKFYWMDSDGNLLEWQEKKEAKISDDLIVFKMNYFVSNKGNMVESKQYLIDLKQESIISAIEYGNHASEKASERFYYREFQTDSQGNLYFVASIKSGEKIFDHLAASEAGMYFRNYIVKIENNYIIDFLKEFNQN